MARHKDLILDDYIEDDYDYEIDYDYGKDSSDFIEDYEEEKYANYESKSTANDDSKVETTKKKETKEIYLSETVSTIIDTISSFSNMFGKVKLIDMENQKMEVALDLFGQETIVEVMFTEIEKV